MPSGVRVTIALIVIVFVVIGLYYTTLESGNTPPPASSDEGLVRTTDADTSPEKTESAANTFEPFSRNATRGVPLGKTALDISQSTIAGEATQDGSADAVANLTANNNENSKPESKPENGQGDAGDVTTLAESGAGTTEL